MDPDARSGVEALAHELSDRGYETDWTVLCPTRYLLPQSRERVYMLALRCTRLSDEARELRRRQLQRAMIVLRGFSPQRPPEALEEVLSRSSRTHTAKKPSRRQIDITEPAAEQPEGPAKKRAWPDDHAHFEAKHLKGADLSQRQAFYQTEGLSDLCDRAKDVLFLKLTHWALKNEKPWTSERALMAVPGQSVSWCPMQADRSPCCTPKGTFVWFQRGKPKRLGGLNFLALQGVQETEVQRWNLDTEGDALLQDLAGNAFNANVCLAVLLAGLVGIDAESP